MGQTVNGNRQALNADITVLASLGRAEHFDQEGGGAIVRTIYCEPYTAHRAVTIALKGTIYDAGGGLWQRRKPHRDPLFPYFYCADVQVESAFPAAARAARPMPIGDGSFGALQNGLNVVDDFDGANLVDNLSVREIAAGGITNPHTGSLANDLSLNTGESVQLNPFISRGVCGAKLTATYRPLMFVPGLSDSDDQFDYVDPQWEPLTFTTQTGRSLFLLGPYAGTNLYYSGLSDTYAVPEVVWRFSVRRLMVPYLPLNTLRLLINKVNRDPFTVGRITYAKETVRFEACETITRRAPDGQLYFDLHLKFLIRTLFDEYYNPWARDYVQGWVGWNWAYGLPTVRFIGIQALRGAYYPVVWNGGLFQAFGIAHSAFLYDTQMTVPAGLTNTLDSAPFKAGFHILQ